MKALERYRRKRDFRATPEPSGRTRRPRGALSFVVQKHDASHLHYDFRLEWDGVLKSWAVPKGPSLDPSQKRLAVEVEDHPLEYGSFEGRIPEGQYGAGTVIVWDRGTWVPEDDPQRAHRRGRMGFRLEGEKLHGDWSLVRMNGRESNGKTNWLLIKKKDEAAKSTRAGDILKTRPESVLSGRAKPRTGARSKSPTTPGSKSRAASRPSRARRERWTPPQLATLVDAPPDGDEWLHEIKLDGYRIVAERAGEKVTLRTRSGQDWTDRFPEIADELAGLATDSVVMDGEIVVLDEHGVSKFQSLQNAIRDREAGTIVYFVFDLLHLDGEDLRKQPLESRKESLRKVLGRSKKGARLRWTDHVIGSGRRFYQAACERGLEGIVSKLREKPYRTGRSRDWLKTKCLRGQELVVVGYTEPSGARAGLGALLLGVRDGGSLRYAGRVGTGFTDSALRELERRLRKLEIEKTAVTGAPRARGVHWVRPELVAEVEFTEWTGDGRLRHPVFRGLREDKPAREVVRERAARTKSRAPAKSRATKDDPSTVGGVTLTHPDRVLYPEQGITKRDLAQYYERIAEHMLPHVADRPLSIVRCPQGRGKDCFYQKHATGTPPAALHSMEIREKNGVGTYFTIDDVAGLVSLVQMGVLEIHHWGCRSDRIELPDRIAFDLDPDPAVEWSAVVDAARQLHARLESMDLVSFLKTTGGKGLHVIVPIERRTSWDEAKAFARAVADEMVREAPDLYLTTISKAKRKGKILIDTFRNTRGATWVAAYSTRARPGAPVSMPIAWSELSVKLRSDAFDVSNVLKKVATRRTDPWKDLESTRQRLPKTT